MRRFPPPPPPPQTPEELSVDLRQMSTVDWGLVWAGWSRAYPGTWVQRFGWELITVGRFADHLLVRTKSGHVLSIQEREDVLRNPERAWYAQMLCWHSTEGASAIDALSEAEAVWPGYLSAASRALGPPMNEAGWTEPAGTMMVRLLGLPSSPPSGDPILRVRTATWLLASSGVTAIDLVLRVALAQPGVLARFALWLSMRPVD